MVGRGSGASHKKRRTFFTSGIDHSRHHVYLNMKGALPKRQFDMFNVYASVLLPDTGRHEIIERKIFYRLVLLIYLLKTTIFAWNCRFDTMFFKNCCITKFFKVEISFETSYIFKVIVLLKSFLYK